jgi:hypothetical protein
VRHTPKHWLFKFGEADSSDKRLWLILWCQRFQVGIAFSLAYDQGVEALESPDLQFVSALLQHVCDLES